MAGSFDPFAFLSDGGGIAAPSLATADSSALGRVDVVNTSPFTVGGDGGKASGLIAVGFGLLAGVLIARVFS